MNVKRLVGALALMAGVMGSASVSLAQQDTIKFGALLPLSGNLAFLGDGERRGVELAIREINESGGVLGKKVEAVYEDSGSPAQTTRKATKLVADGDVVFTVNGGGSASSEAMAEFALRNKMLHVALDPKSESLVTTKANRYFFLVPPTSSMISKAIVPEITKLGKNVFFLTHDYTFGWAQTEWQRRFLTDNGGVDLGETKIPLGTRDFSAQIIAIRSANPDVLVLNVVGADFTALMNQIVEFGLHQNMKIVVPVIDFEDSWLIGHEKNKHINLAGVIWHYSIGPEAEEFTQRYREAFPKAEYPVPTANTYNAYIGVREVLRAMQRANSIDTEKVIMAMEGAEVKDSLKPNPMLIRKADHQFVQDFVLVSGKQDVNAQAPEDIYDIVTIAAGKDIVKPESEVTADMGAFPDVK